MAGPLDGLLLDVTGWTDKQLADGAALITEIGRYGPRPGTPDRWDWQGDIP